MPQEELNQQLSYEQNYREIIRGVRSFIRWHQVPEFRSSALYQDANQFAAPRTQPTSKVSVKLSSTTITSLSLKATQPVALMLVDT